VPAEGSGMERIPAATTTDKRVSNFLSMIASDDLLGMLPAWEMKARLGMWPKSVLVPIPVDRLCSTSARFTPSEWKTRGFSGIQCT
jgi:hypothetical protein